MAGGSGNAGMQQAADSNGAGNGVDAGAGRVRLDWVDALKGLGIVTVVAAHVWTRGPVRDAIYAFHMPLFFILSGYTARHAPWGRMLPASLRGLAVPFLCFAALLLAADFLIEGLRGHRPIFPDWLTGARTILFATERTRGPFTILWFVPCLLLARIVWNALIAGDRRSDSAPVLLAIAALFAVSLLPGHGWHWSPLGAIAVPGAVLMLWAGALWRHRGPPPRALSAVLALLALATLLVFPPLNMKQGDLGWPAVSLAGAVAVTMTLALGVQRLSGPALAVLVSLGRASLVIMYVHVAIIHYLAQQLPKAALFPLALSAAWGLDWLIRRWRLTRRVLLGEGPGAR